MAIDETPVNPAPETACMVETLTSLMPKASMSGLSVMRSMMVEQLGLVTRHPFHPFARCTSISERCSGLTSGMRSGTSASRRWAA